MDVAMEKLDRRDTCSYDRTLTAYDHAARDDDPFVGLRSWVHVRSVNLYFRKRFFRSQRCQWSQPQSVSH